MIKNFYYDRESAPMKFHKLLWYLGLPVSIGFNIYVLWSLRAQLMYGSSLIMLTAVLAAAEIIFNAVAFGGFFRWKSCAWYGIIIGSFLSVFYNIASLALAFSWLHTGVLLLSIILSLIIFLYYKKRKALFFADKAELYYASAPRCPHCGHPIEPGKKLCPMCGMSYSMYSSMDYDEYQNQ